MKAVYSALILWALHQSLGTTKGDQVYAQLAPIVAAVSRSGSALVTDASLSAEVTA